MCDLFAAILVRTSLNLSHKDWIFFPGHFMMKDLKPETKNHNHNYFGQYRDCDYLTRLHIDFGNIVHLERKLCAF